MSTPRRATLLKAGVGAGVTALAAAPLARPEVLASALGTHWAWYACRSSGIVSYVCLWLGLTGGILMSSAWFDGYVHRGRLLAMHQAAGLTGVLLGLGHGIVLLGAEHSRLGLQHILVPFASYNQPALMALGTLSLYGFAMVSGTFWIRSSIGKRTWRYIHFTSFLWFAAALYHAVLMGPDEDHVLLRGLYYGTSIAVVAALVIRLTYVRQPVRRKETPAVRAVS